MYIAYSYTYIYIVVGDDDDDDVKIFTDRRKNILYTYIYI